MPATGFCDIFQNDRNFWTIRAIEKVPAVSESRYSALSSDIRVITVIPGTGWQQPRENEDWLTLKKREREWASITEIGRKLTIYLTYGCFFFYLVFFFLLLCFCWCVLWFFLLFFLLFLDFINDDDFSTDLCHLWPESSLVPCTSSWLWRWWRRLLQPVGHHIVQWLGEQRQTQIMLSLNLQDSDQRVPQCSISSQCCTIPGWNLLQFFDDKVLKCLCANTKKNAAKNKDNGRTFTWNEITPEELSGLITLHGSL